MKHCEDTAGVLRTGFTGISPTGWVSVALSLSLGTCREIDKFWQMRLLFTKGKSNICYTVIVEQHYKVTSWGFFFLPKVALNHLHYIYRLLPVTSCLRGSLTIIIFQITVWWVAQFLLVYLILLTYTRFCFISVLILFSIYSLKYLKKLNIDSVIVIVLFCCFFFSFLSEVTKKKKGYV